LDRRQLDAVYRAVIAYADREKVVTDADLSSIVGRINGVPASRPASRAPRVLEFTSTPAETGYGHGV
jgi:hypothetical protein